jgi:FKBP-type peptidyl-prolyl cis-trans isomerase
MQLFFKITYIINCLAALVLFTQCENNDARNKIQNPSLYKEPLIKANKEAVREENEQIEDYIRRYNLKMENTSTGLRIMMLKHGIGAKAETGRTVKLSYTVTFLSGDTVYSALKDGPMVFVVGKGQVITGLEEAILLLRVGDRAKIIIPSHLAFGLIGDQKKILHKATLVYDIEFISMY